MVHTLNDLLIAKMIVVRMFRLHMIKKKLLQIVHSIIPFDLDPDLKLILMGWFLIPFIKMIMAIFYIALPLHLIPIAVISLIIFLKNLKNSTLLLANSVFAAFCIPTLLRDQLHNLKLELKFIIAGFVFINLIYFCSQKWNNNGEKALVLLLKISTSLQLIFLSIVFAINAKQYGFNYKINDYLQVLTFTRTFESMHIRYDIMSKFSAGHLTKFDWTNTTWAGPLIVLIPFLYLIIFLLNYSKNKKTEISEKIILVATLTFIYLVNSRAMVLFIGLIALLKILQLFMQRLIPYMGYLSFLFPLLLLKMPANLTNGRKVQQDIVMQNLSYFGHGVGTGIKQILELNKTQIFDNIHIEFIHYFGFIIYALAIFILSYWYKKHVNIYSTCLLLFINIFMALNFNLFEMYYVPFLAYLYYKAIMYDNEFQIRLKSNIKL